MDQKTVSALLEEKCSKIFGVSLKDASEKQAYKTVCLCIRDILSEKRDAYRKKVKENEEKEVFYLSMEFLVGTSLRNNLFNLKLEKQFKSVLEKAGFDIESLYALEPDAGLGNGGLGRLASCYMDSLTTLSLPATGFSIRYEFGIFSQKIIDGWQMEFPDDWLGMGDVWLNERRDDAVEVHFGGKVTEHFGENYYRAEHTDYTKVFAIPYDLFISGYNSNAVNSLVLWSAKSHSSLDMTAFSRGEYVKALEENTKAEVISKILYPADDHYDGKVLRLRQQYFFVSASLQTIVRAHYKKYSTLENLADKVAIHINDTHPPLPVPELMRILLDEYSYSWEKAWEICQNTLSYTNHTVMNEALERWNENMFREILPRIYLIVSEINRRLLSHLHQIHSGDFAKIDYMSIIANGEVRMANLCLACCHKINGVSKLHSDLVTKTIFNDYYNLSKEKFTNVTNGIAYRRWLCQANPLLSDFLSGLIGKDFLKDATHLKNLLQYKNDKTVLEELAKIKKDNKLRLAKYIEKTSGIVTDPDSIFDVQIKRLHEYKRQLLNVLHILYLYDRIKSDSSFKIHPHTFIFGAKASSGYFMAKQIIRLISKTADLINSDPDVKDLIKVVFIEDYKVSLAEIIIPSADISEQISVAGKEASGTGNMKLMINGAVTLGTLDGANVEIYENVGEDNIFLFGLTSDEVATLWQKGYNPLSFLQKSPYLQRVLNMLTSGVLGADFTEISKSLLVGGDVYMTLADFESYRLCHEKKNETYLDKDKFFNMSLVNIANAGVFSADRAVKEYAKNIWGMI